MISSNATSNDYFAALQKLDPEIIRPKPLEALHQKFKRHSDRTKRNYDPMSHMTNDLFDWTVFFAQDSAGDRYGVLKWEGAEFVVKYDTQGVYLVIGDSISNWAREAYPNTSEYDTSAFEDWCHKTYGVVYHAPNEDSFPNIYLPYFPA